jgi:ATP-binding cassette subfamily F protein 3
VLEDALEEYDGTLVVVSHDRYFINRVATSLAVVGNGGVVCIAGDYDAWLEWRRERTETADDDPIAPPESRAREAERERRRAEAEERNLRHRRRKAFEERLRPLEEEIEALDRRVAEIDREQGDPDTYRDADRARSLGRERAELDSRLREAWTRWERVAEEDPD